MKIGFVRHVTPPAPPVSVSRGPEMLEFSRGWGGDYSLEASETSKMMFSTTIQGSCYNTIHRVDRLPTTCHIFVFNSVEGERKQPNLHWTKKSVHAQRLGPKVSPRRNDTTSPLQQNALRRRRHLGRGPKRFFVQFRDDHAVTRSYVAVNLL